MKHSQFNFCTWASYNFKIFSYFSDYWSTRPTQTFPVIDPRGLPTVMAGSNNYFVALLLLLSGVCTSFYGQGLLKYLIWTGGFITKNDVSHFRECMLLSGTCPSVPTLQKSRKWEWWSLLARLRVWPSGSLTTHLSCRLVQFNLIQRLHDIYVIHLRLFAKEGLAKSSACDR